MAQRAEKNNVMNMPLIALRGLVGFPSMLLHFDAGRGKSVKALEHAMGEDQLVFLLAQREIKTDDPKPADLYKMGTVAKLKQIVRLPGGESVRVLVEGLFRARLIDITDDAPYLRADIRVMEPDSEDPSSPRACALVRSCQAAFDEYASILPKVSSDIIFRVIDEKSPGKLADFLAANLAVDLASKQSILDERDPYRRIEKLIAILAKEIDILSLEKDIHDRVKEQMDKNQREYYLREQLHTIQNELGEGDGIASDCDEYADKIDKLNITEDVREHLMKEVSRLSRTGQGSPEGTVIRSYLDACIALPWNKKTKDSADIKRARRILDADHYGLEKVKERILEFLAVELRTKGLKGQIICLVGPPGVGKTSIGRSIARALKKKFARVSLGGVRDEADIRGHRKTYIGSMPGRIITAITKAGSSNPVLLLDEVDKMMSDLRGDPTAALLEVLDSEQNNAFRDHYIELPFDLSDVMFITTANTTDTIPRPLLDRMEIIELSSYTSQEKLHIAKEHLVPKQLKKHGLGRRELTISDAALLDIINYYTREAGVRTLEREIGRICRRSVKNMLDRGEKRIKITPDNLTDYLGVKKYLYDKAARRDEIGVAAGLAWTSVGGEMLFVEAAVLPGSGKIELTGSLGEVMKESAHAAISCIRSRAQALGIDPDFYKTKDIHVHFPDGATPKDGPSAGITVASAIVSALTGSPIRHDVAMTGEITIRGRVLEIGGLKEKSMAALRAGIKTVLIPADNERDIAELDEAVRENIRFVPVSEIDTVLDSVLIRKEQTSAEQSGDGQDMVSVVNAQIPSSMMRISQ